MAQVEVAEVVHEDAAAAARGEHEEDQEVVDAVVDAADAAAGPMRDQSDRRKRCSSQRLASSLPASKHSESLRRTCMPVGKRADESCEQHRRRCWQARRR